MVQAPTEVSSNIHPVGFDELMPKTLAEPPAETY